MASRFFSRFVLAFSLAASCMAAQAGPVSNWTHEERMRLYAWVIVQDNHLECQRIVSVREKRHGRVWATCASETGRKALHYRVDRLPLAPGFIERWNRIAAPR